ncbi:hypothetical protein BDR03DRAFT_976043 [Suillus americanus]|nr:hypothetical protein BDR03DRAFT_976043 [Suillus americanus]
MSHQRTLSPMERICRLNRRPVRVCDGQLQSFHWRRSKGWEIVLGVGMCAHS